MFNNRVAGKVVFAVFTLFSLILFPKASFSLSYTSVGQGQTIVLIHAFPTDKQLWEEQQNGLKDKFRIIALDVQGFGNSPAANGQAINMTKYAEDIKELIDSLELSKVIIGGESMGGYIALSFYEQYPEYVSGLILSGTQSIADTNEIKERRERVAQKLLNDGTAQFIDEFLPKLFSKNVSSQTLEMARNMLERQTAEGMASALRGMALRKDMSNVLQNSKLPILIISGSEDAIISQEQSAAMNRLAENSTLVILQNAGHLSNLEQPREWNKAVLDKFGISQ